MKKVKVKKRIKIKSVLVTLLVLIIVGSSIYFYLNSHIKNIYVSGNSILSEQEILDITGIRDYPKRKSINTNKIKNLLLDNPLINSASVNLKYNNKLYIKIIENKPLFYDDLYKKVILSSGERIDNDNSFVGLPILINEVDDNIYDRFIKAFNKVDKSVINKISEIKYEPTELDKDRILLLMNDQIYVYVTLTKIDNLNKYNEIVDSLDDKKGILYLDSGNHFQIKDDKKDEVEEVTTE